MCRHHTGLFLLFLFVLALLQPARAYATSASVGDQNDIAYFWDSYHYASQTGPTYASDSFSYSVLDPKYNAAWDLTSSFQASIGQLHAYNSLECSGACYIGYANGSAAFSDSMTVQPDSPDLYGQPATVRFVLGINGHLTATGGGWYDPEDGHYVAFGQSSWGVTVSSYGETIASRTGWDSSYDGLHGDHIGNVVVDMPVILGEATPFIVGLTTGAQVDYGAANGIADIGHTLNWGGIRSVTLDSNGKPITFSVSSDSGFDYRDSHLPNVPEPGSLSLLALGLGAYGTFRRRA